MSQSSNAADEDWRRGLAFYCWSRTCNGVGSRLALILNGTIASLRILPGALRLNETTWWPSPVVRRLACTHECVPSVYSLSRGESNGKRAPRLTVAWWGGSYSTSLSSTNRIDAGSTSIQPAMAFRSCSRKSSVVIRQDRRYDG